MAFGGRELKVFLTSDVSKFRNGMAAAGGAASDFGSKVSAVATGAAVAIGAVAAKLAVDAVGAAAQFEQSLGAIEQVITGTGASKIEQWADTTAKSLGLTGQAALDAATTFAVGGKTLGLTSDELAARSIRLTETAADLAAAFGGTVADATQKMGAAFRGEFDPIESLGIQLNAAAVASEAAALGFEQVDSAAAKTAAIDSLITKQADLLGVTGQNAREAKTLAGMTQRLSASWEDANRKLGEGLVRGLYAVSDAAGGPDGAVAWLDEAGEGGERAAYGLGLLAAKVVELGNKVAGTTDTVEDGTEANRNWFEGILTAIGPVTSAGVALDDYAASQMEANRQMEIGTARLQGIADEYAAAAAAAVEADTIIQGLNARPYTGRPGEGTTLDSGYVQQIEAANYLAARNDKMEKDRKKAAKAAAKKAAAKAKRAAARVAAAAAAESKANERGDLIQELKDAERRQALLDELGPLYNPSRYKKKRRTTDAARTAQQRQDTNARARANGVKTRQAY